MSTYGGIKVREIETGFSDSDERNPILLQVKSG